MILNAISLLTGILILLYFIIIPIFFLRKDKINPHWSEKYINRYIEDLSKIRFKIFIFVFFLFIFTFSALYLYFGILLPFKNDLGLKLIGIGFRGFVTFGTLLMAISSFYSIKELRNIEKKREDLIFDKEENRKNQIIKMFFNQIEKHLKDLKMISNRIIDAEMNGVDILSDRVIRKIFYDFYKVPTVFEDITGYNLHKKLDSIDYLIL